MHPNCNKDNQQNTYTDDQDKILKETEKNKKLLHTVYFIDHVLVVLFVFFNATISGELKIVVSIVASSTSRINIISFLARDSMLSALYAIARPSVCPSHWWISRKRLKLGS